MPSHFASITVRYGVCGERREVVVVVRAARRVDAHDHPFGVDRGGEQRKSRGVLRIVGDGVLEVEDHGVGAVGRLREAVGAVGGAEEQRRAEAERRVGHPFVSSRSAATAACRSPSARSQTSIVRDAVATTTPSWLRAVCASVTTPCPGRDADSRLDSTTLSP